MSASTCHLCECVCMGITPDDSAPCGCDCEVCDCAQRSYCESEGLPVTDTPTTPDASTITDRHCPTHGKES